ncbi:hypothetical protein [Aneurinibacillus migulanus]|uniref:hypothetical protein n=1 Tax=Aneurinibacillus migulanus TaxID=47500 RepID=UPI000696F149|nr:hypothetical protein [Aneurinibacillus migulanus]
MKKLSNRKKVILDFIKKEIKRHEANYTSKRHRYRREQKHSLKRGIQMFNFLTYLGRTVEVIYLNQNGELSQRKIRLLSVKGGKIRAYCFKRKSTRYFSVENVLAMRPVSEKRVS